MPLSKFTIVGGDGTWVVRAGGAVIGESERALEVVEADDGPVVIYFPREDLGMAFLEPSGTVGENPVLGQASYFSLVTESEVMADVAWSFEAPSAGAERLAGHIAFDARRVAVEAV
jgi:uncharacterized protein (DUF427 family)